MIVLSQPDTAPPPAAVLPPAPRVRLYGGYRIVSEPGRHRVYDAKGRLLAQAATMESAEFALAECLDG